MNTTSYKPNALASAELTLAALGGVARNWIQRIAVILGWWDRARQRQHLLQLDDRLLRDIGLTREDVEREAAKPFWRP